jgi:hypothetical protein
MPFDRPLLKRSAYFLSDFEAALAGAALAGAAAGLEAVFLAEAASFFFLLFALSFGALSPIVTSLFRA